MLSFTFSVVTLSLYLYATLSRALPAVTTSQGLCGGALTLIADAPMPAAAQPVQEVQIGYPEYTAGYSSAASAPPSDSPYFVTVLPHSMVSIYSALPQHQPGEAHVEVAPTYVVGAPSSSAYAANKY